MKAPDSVIAQAQGRMVILSRRVEDRANEIEHHRKVISELKESLDRDHKELSEIRGWLQEMESPAP